MFIRGLFRLFYYAVMAYVVYSVYRFFKNLGRPRQGAKPRAQLSGVMVKDEACQIYLPKDQALRETIGGREYFFCSKECREKFLQERKGAGRG
jgi:YHS domain-containing protein